MHSRRDFLKALAGGAAAATAASVPVGSALAATGIQVQGSPDSAAVIPSGTPRAGWTVYDQDAITPAHMTALRALRPTIVRWFLSWDRYHTQPKNGGSGGIAPQPNWLASPYKAFFQELAPSAANPSGTTVVIQMQVKSPSWEGDNYPTVNPGTKWARKDPFFGRQYPDRFGVASTYGAFVKTLNATLAALNVTVIWEAWNEADLRSQIGVIGAAENYLDPWYVNPFNFNTGIPFYFWSGGAGTLWRSLYQQLPGASWGSSGLIKPNWVQRTAQFPELTHISPHRYYPYGKITPANYVKDIENLVRTWDNAAPGLPKRKVFLGECGLESLNQHTNLPFAATLYRRHLALSQAHTNPASPLYGRYVGTVAHNGGKNCAMSWQLAPTDPAAAWWQYKPQYEQYPA